MSVNILMPALSPTMEEGTSPNGLLKRGQNKVVILLPKLRPTKQLWSLKQLMKELWGNFWFLKAVKGQSQQPNCHYFR